MKKEQNQNQLTFGEYKFGFHDDEEPVLSTGKGLNEGVIHELSAAKWSNLEWMLEFRLKSMKTFKNAYAKWEQTVGEIDLMT